MQYLDATSCNMRITIVGVLALSVFVGLCAAQCMIHQSQPSTHGKNSCKRFYSNITGPGIFKQGTLEVKELKRARVFTILEGFKSK